MNDQGANETAGTNSGEATAVGPFFALTLALMAAAQGPGLLATFGVVDGDPNAFMGLAALGLFSPAIAAVVVLLAEKNGPGLRSLFARLRLRPASIAWYPLALFGLPALYALTALLWSAVAPAAVPVLFLPENAAHVVAMFMVPVLEEFGWRGFALPRLQRRHSPLVAALILGAVWAVWHIAMFLAVSRSLPIFALSMTNIVFLSVVFSWVFNRTNGSLIVAILLHAALHLNNPYRSIPDDIIPTVLYTGVIAAVAIVSVVVDKRAWRRLNELPNR